MVKYLKTPITDGDIKSLKTGDVVYISGTMVTGRDEAHKRAVCECEAPGINLDGLVLYHAGPIVKDDTIIACGPTTSKRMEAYEAEFIRRYGVKLIVGKGGMGDKTRESCIENVCAHAIYPGGCAVIAADSMKRIKDEIWSDLGMPEAMWVLEVENFGPCIVNIDTHGGDMVAENIKAFRERVGK